ncbi:IS3 family transposase [Ktedonosporobacter rubrisoli]|uniref:IS3 family transposase n=1 Tax=Ktedonosporobacter rubrisoli TaxID=2509675 RepID=UPI0013EE41A0|nr:IS3 family transposase [Ktedonosporobacter rubrisoli]
MELARTLCASGSPINKSQLARTLGIARSSLYTHPKRPKMDKELAVRIEALHEHDDTMGHRKLAVLLGTGKNRVKRIMRKYGLAARRKRKKYVYPGKAAQTAPNLLREGRDAQAPDVVFSDIFEVRLADGSRVRGCFALRKQTRHILGLAFDYHMRAHLVTELIQTLSFETPGWIWHSDQGKQYGAEPTRTLLLQKGFLQSMSRAGTPTDNGYAERFVGLFKLAVAERRPYRSLGQFLQAAQNWVNFYNRERPHEGLGNLSPQQYAELHNLERISSLSLL